MMILVSIVFVFNLRTHRKFCISGTCLNDVNILAPHLVHQLHVCLIVCEFLQQNLARSDTHFSCNQLCQFWNNNQHLWGGKILQWSVKISKDSYPGEMIHRSPSLLTCWLTCWTWPFWWVSHVSEIIADQNIFRIVLCQFGVSLRDWVVKWECYYKQVLHVSLPYIHLYCLCTARWWY